MLSTRRAGILTSGLSVVDMDRQTSIFATTNLRQGICCRNCRYVDHVFCVVCRLPTESHTFNLGNQAIINHDVTNQDSIAQDDEIS